MAFVLKFIAIIAQWGVAFSLAPGDCAFVGVYGEKDDFAILLMEDVDGESISVTDGSFKDKDFQAAQQAKAKKHVNDAVKGTVLRKSDFDTDSGSFAAPVSLTVFKGNPSSPTPLCGINLEGKPGNTAVRRLGDEVALLNLGETETAEYAGPTSGSKDELLEGLTNPMNWLQDSRAVRKLSGFTIASVQNTTTSMTTTSDGNQTTETTTTTSTIGGGDSHATGHTAILGGRRSMQHCLTLTL
ncbi:unnamed protein product, partial [Durusdinium trenchii]